jgi:signal peptidase I
MKENLQNKLEKGEIAQGYYEVAKLGIEDIAAITGGKLVEEGSEVYFEDGDIVQIDPSVDYRNDPISGKVYLPDEFIADFKAIASEPIPLDKTVLTEFFGVDYFVFPPNYKLDYEAVMKAGVAEETTYYQWLSVKPFSLNRVKVGPGESWMKKGIPMKIYEASKMATKLANEDRAY